MPAKLIVETDASVTFNTGYRQQMGLGTITVVGPLELTAERLLISGPMDHTAVPIPKNITRGVVLACDQGKFWIDERTESYYSALWILIPFAIMLAMRQLLPR